MSHMPVIALETPDPALNPITCAPDLDWLRRRARYRHPALYHLSLHTRQGRALKRLVDIAGSAAALTMLAPLFLVTAIAIRVESPGGVFFQQPRVGAGGRSFRFWKFRSMVKDAEALKAKLAAQNESLDGVIFKMKNDPRVTKVGRFIRKFSIDELPQFTNVLRGDMSLVGPRPPVPKEVVLYQQPAWMRLGVIPGLTCVWQVSGRSSIGFKRQVSLDTGYILDQNVFYDLYLIAKTVPAVLKGDGAF